VQVNGRNYLIPANADIPDEKRVAVRRRERFRSNHLEIN
jgi:hypothetical protein